MSGEEDRKQIEKALDALPQPQRDVYRLSAVDGLDHSTIAARLGLNVAEVETLLADALVMLDHLLDNGGR